MTRKTSIDAYNTIKESGLLSKRKWDVYDILFNFGPLTANEVIRIAAQKYPTANHGGFNTRLSELKRQGVVAEVGSKKDPVSNHENILWDVTANLPTKWEKAKKHKCKTCDGKGYLLEQQGRLF